MINALAVFLGGGIGAMSRYAVTKLSVKILGKAIFGTLISNILGCFLIGCILGYTLQKAEAVPAELKLFLTVGFLGGLTTFSTFSNESFCLLKDGKLLYGALYMIGSLTIGVFSTFIGYTITKHFIQV